MRMFQFMGLTPECDVAKTCVFFYKKLKQQFDLDDNKEEIPCDKCHHNQSVRETERSFLKIHY